MNPDAALPKFPSHAPLIPGRADAACVACVVMPARDEEDHLLQALDALANQVDCHGAPLETESYEILLLLNNCRDRSVARVQAWAAGHPWVTLHVVEREFAPEQAHVGTARASLMDTAWCRLQGDRSRACAILSTDADTIVRPDWIAANLRAIADGAEAVGGQIALSNAEYLALPAETRRCHADDAHYGALVAKLEDLLDPQPGDPWPRHLDHYGASLACTPEAYARAGGMPACRTLEDAAFVDRLWRAEVRLRHDPAVRVVTSARLQGRATTGLAGQLRLWSGVRSATEHRVRSASFLAHRFTTLRALRDLRCSGMASGELGWLPIGWRERVGSALQHKGSAAALLSEIDADALIEQTFAGQRDEPVTMAIAHLAACIETLEGQSQMAVRSSTETR